MARFLVTVWPFRSHYFPLIGIAHALRRRGHNVAFCSGADAKDPIEREGFTLFPFQRVDERRVNDIMFAREDYASWQMPFRFQGLLREWLVGTVPDQVDDITSAMDKFRPDVIVTETSMWGPILVLRERERVPVSVFSTVAACLIPDPTRLPLDWGCRGPAIEGLGSLPRSRTARLGRCRETWSRPRTRCGATSACRP